MTVDPRVLAQIAAAAYRNVSDENRILAPAGWTQIATYPASGPSDDPVSGFSAVAFRGPGGEIVISYAGTNVASKLDNDWIRANAPAALGMYSPQVAQAGEFYWQVLNRPDAGLANKGRITFTGHSLGGGLASLMATYFDLPATTFDSAPFELSAFVGSALDQYAEKFAAAGIADAGWQQYRAAQATASLPQLFAQREARVSHVFVTNEALEPWRFQYNAIVGSERPLDSGAAVDHATPTQLHSMQLAWAMLASQDFAAEVRKLPRLVALIDDERLFGRDRTTRSQDFLSLLLKSEQVTGMLTQFTGDLKDISGKFPAASATVSDALLALTMAHYYRMSNGFDAQVGEAVRSIEGGLELAIGGAGWNGRGFARAYELLRDMVDLLSGGGADAARSWQKDRLVIADGTALSFLDAAGKGDLVLGGTVADSIALGDGDDYASGLGGVDILDGGAGDDVLDGGAGADTLDGGPGNDSLIGGVGADVYRFGGAFGHDVIEDSGGDGQIRIDDAPLPQGLRVPGRDNVWASADGAFTYVLAPSIAGGSSGTLYVQKAGAGTITIGNYAPGQLGIDLSDAPAPPTDYTIVAVADNPAIMLGDRVLATGGADRVLGTAQHDAIVGLEGDDLIEAGEGGDVVLGGFGADRIHGGGGNDAIRGGGYRDDGNYFNVYTSSFGTTPVEWINVPYGGGEGAAAYVALPVGGGLAWAGIGFGGLTAYSGNLDQDGADLIDAGAGDDLIYADGGNDLILAGSGGDRVHAGAGDDGILGEGGDDELRGDYVPPGRIPQPGGMEDQGADVIDGGDGSDRIWGAGRDDALHGGAGNDRLWGDDEVADLDPAYHGSDLLDGGSGNDQLIGQGADDTLHGGSDDDLLLGDDAAARLPGEHHGDDRLDGEAGNDELQGQGGADVLYGGSGNDTLFGDDLTAVLAGRFHGADHLDGEDGDDYLEGHGGADQLFGGDGVDTLYGDAVATHVDPAFHGDDLLDGEGGNDLLIGGGGEDMLFGGGGNDRLLGDDVQSMLPAAAHADDYLDGEDGDDMLAGLGGADLLVGGEGNDTLMGDGIATDVAVTAHGDDVLDGGDGADTLLGGGGNDTVIGGSGNDRLDGDDVAGNVDGSGHGDDLLDGGAGDDVLHGGGRDDALFGGDGADYLHGDDSPGSLGIAFHGNDVLDGGAGADNLVGGAGDDHLTGGSGSDVLRGGDHDEAVPSGSDTFHFDLGSGYDWIIDRDPTAGSSDALVFGAAVQRSSLAMGRSGADLVIVLPFTLDRVAVRDYFLAASSEPVPGPGLIEALKFADGASWSFADVTAFIAGGGGYAGTYGFDTLSSLDDRANDANFNAYDDKSTAGDDTIDARGGDDAIRGREGNDWLIGGAGNDVLDGGPGNDALEGGTGDDLLNAGSGDDLFIFRPGDGSDTINPYKPSGQADVDTLRFGAGIAPGDLYMYRLGQSLVIRIGDGADRVVVQDHYGELGGLNRIEFADGTAWGAPEFEPRVLRVTPYDDEVVGSEQADAFDGGLGDDLLYGHGGDDLLAGGAGDDMLYGDDGNDTLDGGEGADVLRGGPGNDVYFVDRAEDDPSEVSNAGVDEIRSSVSLALPGGFENLVLLGSSAIDGTGNELNNRLTGNDGVNVLTGGPGNDTYVVQNTDDRVVEAAAQGTDTVQASVSFLLPANVENLTLAGTAAIDGTGNASNNTIQGNGAANVLDGGAGGDALRGGGGDDVYVVDSASDVVTENANEGFDTVRASVSFTLANNIEKLELTGAAAISGTGNSLANVLAGNGASNALTGGAGNDLLDGGAGSDTMRGGTGDDTYVVNAGTDVVTENANEGADTVQSSVTLTLAANVEHLQLTGAAAINGTGNSLANHLRGNSAANTLNGSGSNDVLQGAGGTDTLTDTSGNNMLDGGDGADGMNGGTGREFIAGGTGNDTLKLGGGADIVAFNRGHGADSVTAPTSGSGLGETNDTLTLGGVRYADLRLARSGSDLLIKLAGTSDSVKLAGWYSASGNRTVTTLQVIVDSTADYNAGSADPLVNRRVVRLNFTSLVNAFNAAYAANPSIGDWAVPGGTLSSAFVAGSDTQAIGGALAYHYGRDGNLSALDFAAASAVLGAASFATAAQAFATSPTTGGVRLMSAAPVVEEPAPTVSRLAAASVSGDAESLPREGEVPVSPVEAMRSPSRVQALAESWAVALADSADSGSNRYLTPGSWLPGAGIADVEVTTSASGQATEGIEAGRSSLLEDGTVGGNDAALVAAVVKRWSAIDEAMLGLDVQGDRLLGGTAMEVCGSFEERLGLTPLAMGAEVQATRPRWPVATY